MLVVQIAVCRSSQSGAAPCHFLPSAGACRVDRETKDGAGVCSSALGAVHEVDAHNAVVAVSTPVPVGTVVNVASPPIPSQKQRLDPRPLGGQRGEWTGWGLVSVSPHATGPLFLQWPQLLQPCQLQIGRFCLHKQNIHAAIKPYGLHAVCISSLCQQLVTVHWIWSLMVAAQPCHTSMNQMN